MTATPLLAPQVRRRMAPTPQTVASPAKTPALPPHSRRSVPLLALPYVPASQTTAEHLASVFAAERLRLQGLLA